MLDRQHDRRLSRGGALRISLHSMEVAERISSRCSGVGVSARELGDVLKWRLCAYAAEFALGDAARDRTGVEGDVARDVFKESEG
jgi:hypothetical protein